jgi:hypothetical protein
LIQVHDGIARDQVLAEELAENLTLLAVKIRGTSKYDEAFYRSLLVRLDGAALAVSLDLSRILIDHKRGLDENQER